MNHINVMYHKTVYMNNVYNLILLGNMIIYTDFKVKILFREITANN